MSNRGRELIATACMLRRNGFIGAAERLLELKTENERLRNCIRWALGESPEGMPDFPRREEGEGAYWWRKGLRNLSGVRFESEATK